MTDCKTAGKIFFVMGKSASGKDTIYKKLLEYFPELKTVTLYTTRPVREGETEGVEYHFIGEEQLEAMKSKGRVIEMRTYQTMYGPWSYATVEDGQIDLSQGSYMMIGTLESYESKQQKHPKYTVLCRRFLADETDFSEEKLAQAGITAEERYENQELSDCLKNIAGKIEKTIRRYARG